MANPQSAEAALNEAKYLYFKRVRKLGHATKLKRSQHVGYAAEVIWNKFEVGVHRWRLKHVRWYLSVVLADVTNNTRYQQWCALRDFIVYVRERPEWLDVLRGPWTDPKGKNQSRSAGGPQRIVREIARKKVSKGSSGFA